MKRDETVREIARLICIGIGWQPDAVYKMFMANERGDFDHDSPVIETTNLDRCIGAAQLVYARYLAREGSASGENACGND